jgi:hypothetical protein
VIVDVIEPVIVAVHVLGNDTVEVIDLPLTIREKRCGRRI